MLRQFLRAVGVLIVSASAIPIAVIGTVLAAFLFLPLPATLPEANPVEGGQVTKIVTVSGEEIGYLEEYDRNIPFRPEDVPEVVKQAVISAEDQNFYEHKGVDFRGTARALWHDIRGSSVLQGGSTITQQYVKLAYTNRERTLLRKIREAILASQLERTHRFSKDDILYKYLSTIFLGEGAYGIAAAADTYFRKPVSQIGLSEAALLAGLIPAPSRYEPRGNPELAEQKRQLVLTKMYEQGYLPKHIYDVAMTEKLVVVTPENPPPPPGTPATVVYGRVDTANSTKFPYFVDYVERYLTERYPPDLVYKGGLTVITTIDPELQAQAERARDQAIGRYGPKAYEDCPGNGQPCVQKQTPLEMSIVSVEPPTGYVKALVGGRDFNAPGGQVNLALGGCYPKELVENQDFSVEAECWDPESDFVGGGGIGRQAGSSWKPFILAAGFAKGYTPDKVYSGQSPYSVGDGHQIENFGGASYGSMTLRSATHRSVNTAYARLLKDVGLKEAGEMAKKLGISTTFINAHKGLSYTLGVDPSSPLEMASAYGVFANRGIRVEPTPVLQVRCGAPMPNSPCDEPGKILEDNTKPEGDQVIDQAVADNVTDVLKGVITGGTGTRANIGRPAAGKTGTAQDSKDSWFVGYTPTLSTAIWIGYRDKELTMRGIGGCGLMTGGCLPAQTWRVYMTQALADVPVTDFSEPAPIKKLAEELKRQERRGIDPGNRRRITGTDGGGPFVVGPPEPEATAPPTTTTTRPPRDGDEDEGGGPDEPDAFPDPSDGDGFFPEEPPE